MLQACEKEASAPPYAETLDSYYIESTHLGVATADSVNTFAHKVLRMTEVWPEVKREKQYIDLTENIRQNMIRLHIIIDGSWDSVIEYNQG